MKGVKYPVQSPADIKDRLSGVNIKGLDGAEVVEGLTYPIRTPAQLLHEIKEYLQMRGSITSSFLTNSSFSARIKKIGIFIFEASMGAS